ncbi:MULTISPECIES: AMP-binding protein [unclassified Rhodococcus (in: high G+C Gram-positive bacteria)]|uniref:AMP-binding protein n=1 Tax=unclassified Rhodococcus (in: high G+C Gram-positive bacteria) TaxID=192944 RepID=UPI003394C6E4
MSELLTGRIARYIRDKPSSLAVVDSGGAVTYGEFGELVTAAAAGMSGMRRVAVLPTSDIGSLVAVTAAMSSGIGVVLLHRHLLPEQFARVLSLTRPDVVLAAPNQHARLRRMGAAAPTSVDSIQVQGVLAHGAADEDSELLIGITSGTTGEPKLFVRDQRSWARTLDRSDSTFDIRAGDRVATPGVLDHTHFLYGALHGLTRGAIVDVRPVDSSLSSGATHLYSVPTIAWDVVRSGIGPVPSVREVLSSAARWPSSGRSALQEALPNASLVHFYGASELSFVSFDRGIDPGPGTLFDGVDIEIRDSEIRDSIVHVRSDMLFDGYLTEDGVTGGPVDGWMTVGDRGRLGSGENLSGGENLASGENLAGGENPAGGGNLGDMGSLEGRQLTLLGRDTDILIRAGLNVELAPIESALTAIPGIVEAACVGVPDVRMGEVPAVVIVEGANPPSTAEIWRHLRRELPSPSIPVQILTLEQLPRTPRGKVDRQEIGAIFATVRTAPSTTNQTVSEPLS